MVLLFGRKWIKYDSSLFSNTVPLLQELGKRGGVPGRVESLASRFFHKVGNAWCFCRGGSRYDTDSFYTFLAPYLFSKIL